MIKKGIWKNVVTVPVQMVVDKKDPSSLQSDQTHWSFL